MSSSSFSWRLCCCERHWLKSSASCGHLSSVISCTSGEVPTNHEQIQGPTAAQAAILRQLVRLQTKLATFSRQGRKGSAVILCHGSMEHNCTTAAICVRPVPSLHSCIHTLQDFTTRKPQHLRAGFQLLLSLRLFLQGLLAICGFFSFCCSCFYRVRLELQ